jgi:hypothetical protein
MEMLQLSRSGVDTLTFWSSEENPGGCIIQTQRGVLAVASIRRSSKDGKHEVGLVGLTGPVYQYIGQIHMGDHPVPQHDFDICHEGHFKVSIFPRKGGLDAAPGEIQFDLKALYREVKTSANLKAELDAALQRLEQKGAFRGL